MSQLAVPSADHALVAELLSNSVAVDARVREEAYARIVELESRPTFLATLIDVAYLGDAQISKLAFICAKNALARLRGFAAIRAASGIDVDSMDPALNILMAKLLSVFEAHLKDETKVIGKDFALLVRKVCRKYYPQNWMPMHDLLVRGVEAALSDPVTSTRTFNCVFLLYHIFKEKSTLRLMRDRNDVAQLAEVLYPLVSRLWVKHWLERWSSGSLDALKFASNVSNADMELSRYLDSLVIALYTRGLRNVYQRTELLELLKLIFVKMKLHMFLLQSDISSKEKLQKNSRRLLRGVTEMLDKEPMVFAFVDPSVALNPIFDYLAVGTIVPVISQCMEVLCAAFKSPIVNNDRYMNQFYAVHGESDGLRASRKPREAQFVVCATFDEMKSQCEMAASCTRGSSVTSSFKKTLSPIKGSYNAIGTIAEHMSRQATFFFWECIYQRGGLLQLLDFLRDKYLTLDAEAIAEWSEEIVPLDSPPQSLAQPVIEAMKVTGLPILNWIAESIVGIDCRSNFSKLDSYLILYSIAYPSLANYHTSKHYLTILGAFKKALSEFDSTMAKLLIYRCSGIVNAWAERINLFEEQTKSELMHYLVSCLCFEGDSVAAVNLRAQHVVPFHCLYSKTIDEPFWDFLRQDSDVQRIMASLVHIAKINAPVIQHRSIDLLCKMCLEYDTEVNNFGHQLSDVLAVLSDGPGDLQLSASLLQTSLGFLNSIHWRRYYVEESYINGHLLRFLFHLLFRTVVVGSGTNDQATQSCQRLLQLCKYAELEEDVLMLWICLLRVLPRKVDTADHELLNNALSLFPLLIAYLTDRHHGEQPGEMRVSVASPMAVDVVTEYLAVVLDLSKSRLSSAGSATGMVDPSGGIYERSGEVWFQLTGSTSCSVAFSVSQLQSLCVEALKRPDGDPLSQCGLRLLSMLTCGFGRFCVSSANLLMHMHDVLLNFFVTLNEAAILPENAPQEYQRLGAVCLKNGSGMDSTCKWQVATVSSDVLNNVSSVIPIICRWGFDAPASFSEALIRVLGSGRFSNMDAILLSLLQVSKKLVNNAYLRLGALICCCLIVSTVASHYSGLNLFVLHGEGHGHDGNPETEKEGFSNNPHPDLQGVYLPCYLLRLVHPIAPLYLEAKRAFCFSTTKASLMEGGPTYVLPPSKRLHIFTNASSTYQSTNFPIIDLSPQELFLGALKSTVSCIVSLSQTLGDRGVQRSAELMFADGARLHAKLREVLEGCTSGAN
ncbi:importin beta-2 subunit family protein, putative [Babesia ovata]|uniref:Importin beta-2 subunit family protein, putative n=1 Tax=Babesia ovata TaxID=189622 RepID=A0A2H6KC32_9APIC|nr:importin beta-2 subunit family protein, putative [Babesia ovata]GBE60551.1 importin beta-2 subunit family protein, putative [Babesia ovata]